MPAAASLVRKFGARGPWAGGAVARRTVRRRRGFRGLGLILLGSEALDQDATALLVRQEAGTFVGPIFIGNFQIVAPRTAVRPPQRRILLAPRVTAARSARRLFHLLTRRIAMPRGSLFLATLLVAFLPAFFTALRRRCGTRCDRPCEIAASLGDDLRAELRSRRDEITALLGAATADPGSGPIPRARRDGPLPLSSIMSIE